MATKKENEPTPINSNVNNNTNNINLNVKVEHPKVPRKPKVVEKKKTNWVVKTLIVGAITTLLSIGGYYIKKNMDSKGKSATDSSESIAKPIERIKEN